MSICHVAIMSVDIKFTEYPLNDTLPLTDYRGRDNSLWASIFPEFYCKYAPLHAVKEQGCALVNTIVEHAPVAGDREFTSVDVKVQPLSIGETTCLPGWHKDSVSDPDALHHLFIIGDNRTWFKMCDGEVELPHGHYATYGSDVDHRGPEVEIVEVRLLVRVTESNVIRPNTVFRKTYPYRYIDGNVEKS